MHSSRVCGGRSELGSRVLRGLSGESGPRTSAQRAQDPMDSCPDQWPVAQRVHSGWEMEAGAKGFACGLLGAQGHLPGRLGGPGMQGRRAAISVWGLLERRGSLEALRALGPALQVRGWCAGIRGRTGWTLSRAQGHLPRLGAVSGQPGAGVKGPSRQRSQPAPHCVLSSHKGAGWGVGPIQAVQGDLTSSSLIISAKVPGKATLRGSRWTVDTMAT